MENLNRNSLELVAALEVLLGFAKLSFLWAHGERRDVVSVAHRAGESLVAVKSAPHFRVSARRRCRL